MDKYVINDIKAFKPFLTVTLISHGQLLDQLFHNCVTPWAFLSLPLQCFRRGTLSSEVVLEGRNNLRSIKAHHSTRHLTLSTCMKSCLHSLIHRASI